MNTNRIKKLTISLTIIGLLILLGSVISVKAKEPDSKEADYRSQICCSDVPDVTSTQYQTCKSPTPSSIDSRKTIQTTVITTMILSLYLLSLMGFVYTFIMI